MIENKLNEMDKYKHSTHFVSLTRYLDSKSKKWAFFSILFFLLFALDDYSVAALDIPPLNQMSVSEGVLRVVRAGVGKRGGGDMLYLLKDRERIKVRCRINTLDYSSCITLGDPRFYDKKSGNESWLGKSVFITPNTSEKIKLARVWWYEASIFGPLKEKRLLQLDVDEARIISYEQQKAKYMLQKSNHNYMPTILLVFSVICFFLLQVVTNQSLNIQKEK